MYMKDDKVLLFCRSTSLFFDNTHSICLYWWSKIFVIHVNILIIILYTCAVSFAMHEQILIIRINKSSWIIKVIMYISGYICDPKGKRQPYGARNFRSLINVSVIAIIAIFHHLYQTQCPGSYIMAEVKN